MSRKGKSYAFRCSALTALALLPGIAVAEQITVGDEGVATIQAAVDLALTNADLEDTILIPAGDYEETVTVQTQGTSQENLTIKTKGKGKAKAHIRGVNNGPAIVLNNAQRVTLQNLTVESASPADAFPALLISGLSANIIVNKVNGVAGDDNGAVVLGIGVVGVEFRSSDFSGMLGTGFRLDGSGHELRQCKADACGQNAFVVTSEGLNVRIISCSAQATGGSSAADPGVITLRGNGNQVIDTVIGGGGDHGLWTVGNGHTIEDCVSNGNVGAGYRLTGSLVRVIDSVGNSNNIGLLGGGLGTHIVGSRFENNASHGIDIIDGGATLEDNTARNNLGHGLHIANNVLSTVILDGSYQNNGGEGILVEGQLSWLENNVAKGGDGFINLGTNNHGRNNKVKGGQGQNDF